MDENAERIMKQIVELTEILNEAVEFTTHLDKIASALQGLDLLNEAIKRQMQRMLVVQSMIVDGVKSPAIAHGRTLSELVSDGFIHEANEEIRTQLRGMIRVLAADVVLDASLKSGEVMSE